VAIAAVLRAGFVVVNVNPLYTARELEHHSRIRVPKQSSCWRISRRRWRRSSGNEFAPRRTDVDGGHARLLEGLLVNFAVRHVRKMVPAFDLSLEDGRTVTRFNLAIADGTRMTLRRAELP